MTEYTIDMIKGTTVMEQMRSLIKVVIDFINGEGGDVEEVRQMVLTEIADRTAQDGQLQLQIQGEATARISQDNELRTQIQTEVTQRESQVQTLTADIEYEQQIRQDSDDALVVAIQTAVQGEADARQAQDATLQQALQNEVTARQSQDDTLLQGLQNEAGARQSQDAQLSTDIQNEATQRASADSGLGHDISDLTTRVGTVETSVSDIIDGTQVVGAAQNQGYADNQGEAQVGDHIVSTTANIGDDTHPVKIVNGVPVQVSNTLLSHVISSVNIEYNSHDSFFQRVSGLGINSIFWIKSLYTSAGLTLRDALVLVTNLDETSKSLSVKVICGEYLSSNAVVSPLIKSLYFIPGNGVSINFYTNFTTAVTMSYSWTQIDSAYP